MTLDQLRIFVAVADKEHVTRASEVLHLTQSTISAAIKTLETTYGVQLFHRIGRRIELTHDGRAFLEEARSLMSHATAVEKSLRDLGSAEKGQLSIAATQTIASYWLPPHLVEFRKRYPACKLDTRVGTTAQVLAAVIEGTADIGYVGSAVSSHLVHVAEVGRDQLTIVVPTDHPWASVPQLSIFDLADESWVMRESDSGTRHEFEMALAKQGIVPRGLNVVLELPTDEALCAAIKAGFGVGVLSGMVANSVASSGALARVRCELPSRPFYGIRHRERHISAIANAFARITEGAPLPVKRPQLAPTA